MRATLAAPQLLFAFPITHCSWWFWCSSCDVQALHIPPHVQGADASTGCLLRAYTLSDCYCVSHCVQLPDIGINLILELITQSDVRKAWYNLIPVP